MLSGYSWTVRGRLLVGVAFGATRGYRATGSWPTVRAGGRGRHQLGWSRLIAFDPAQGPVGTALTGVLGSLRATSCGLMSEDSRLCGVVVRGGKSRPASALPWEMKYQEIAARWELTGALRALEVGYHAPE